MRRTLELGYLLCALVLVLWGLRADDLTGPPGPALSESAQISAAAVAGYGDLLADIFDDAASQLDAGTIADDQALKIHLQPRTLEARAQAFAPFDAHMQAAIGVGPDQPFDPVRAARLCRDFAEGFRQ